MSERSFFSLRYASPGYTFILMIILVAYPKLQEFIFPIEDTTLGAFLAFASLLGGAAIGFLVSQVWYVLYLQFLRGRYGKLPELIATLTEKFALTDDKQQKLLFLDYLHRRSKKPMRIYTQRRYDLMHLCGSTIVSLILGFFIGVFVRVGALLPSTKLETLLDISLAMPLMTTYDLGIILVTVFLVLLLIVGLRFALKQHAMAVELSVSTVLNSKKFKTLEVKKLLPKSYFKQKKSKASS